MPTFKKLSGHSHAKKTFCLGLQLALTALIQPAQLKTTMVG